MNLTQALNSALPEIPARTLSERYPRRPPDAVFKEHLEDGQPIVRVLVPSMDSVYRFTAQNWELAELFDGRRSYAEIAETHSRNKGTEFSIESVREFAASLDTLGFWYKTSQEKNIALMQQSADERRKLLKSRKNKWGDLSQILFPAFNPDSFLTWWYGKTSFVYSTWFTLLTFAVFIFATWITVTHWSEIGRDTLQFFNFTQKSWWDVAVFWILTLVAMCWHEMAHGHACKHYGGRVPSMGFLLIYLTPAFYTDTSEGFIKGSRYQRLIIAMAGAWAELYICAVATIVWWGTAPGQPVHDIAYMLMLISGIASLAMNWNPLMKLDGYHMLCEIVGVSELKEDSTLYVSAWVKRNIWRLPVEVPYVPRKQRLGFAVYALLSGLYSYSVLYILARFVGNIFRNFNPEWSFVPELATAALIFRSRIRTLVNFMKFVYLDKKDRVRQLLRSPRVLAFGAVTLAILLLIPWWREAAEGRFILEPVAQAQIRTEVPGTVTNVYANEGAPVEAGALLFTLRNAQLQSNLARTEAQYDLASHRATSAALLYADFGTAQRDRDQLALQNRELKSETANLNITAPIAGIVLTFAPGDRLGSYVTEGTQLLEIADLSRMRARIYLSEHDMYELNSRAQSRILVEGLFRKFDAQVSAISPASSEILPGLIEKTKYQGLRPPQFYLVDLLVPNTDGQLRPGMVGTARVYGERRSLASFGLRSVQRFFARKIW
jgi:putative peptide zinc metalloprotease protein